MKQINYGLQKIFPTYVLREQVKNFDVIQQEYYSECDKIKFTRTSDEFGRASQIFGNMRSDIISQLKLTSLAIEIDEKARIYFNQLNQQFNKYIRHSWINKIENGDYLQTHHHHHVWISGTFFLKTSNSGGEIYFESPCSSATNSGLYFLEHQRFYIHPKDGDIILFPGWLHHGVLPNKSEEERISIAFNLYFSQF